MGPGYLTTFDFVMYAPILVIEPLVDLGATRVIFIELRFSHGIVPPVMNVVSKARIIAIFECSILYMSSP